MGQFSDPDDAKRARELVGFSKASDRNKRIALSAIDGATYKAVGQVFGLSRERTRQITAKLLREGMENERKTFENSDDNDQSTPIAHCNMTVRTTNCLLRHGLVTIDKLRSFVETQGEKELLRIPNLGRHSLVEIYDLLGVAAPQKDHSEKLARKTELLERHERRAEALRTQISEMRRS